MGILDSVLGSLAGGGASSPLGSILGSLLDGGGGSSGGGIGGLLQQLTQAGHGDKVNSWVGNGPNQSIDPQELGNALGQDRVSQWSQQTGMDQGSLLSQLSNLIPHAVNQMSPNGQMPSAGSGSGSPFDEGGVELPKA